MAKELDREAEPHAQTLIDEANVDATTDSAAATTSAMDAQAGNADATSEAPAPARTATIQPGTPELALARFLFNRPLAISRIGFKRLADSLAASLRGKNVSPRALFGFDEEDDPCDLYELDAATGIGTITIHGVLVNRADSFWARWCGCPSYEGIAAALDEAAADPGCREIVGDFDTPGGDVEGCFDLVDRIYAMRGKKPMAAIVNESALSAGYALASAFDRIYVPRTAGVGSIGVIAEHWDWSGFLEQCGIKVTSIFAGDHKNDGSPYEPLSAEAKAEIQKHIDAMNVLFVKTVARNRTMSVEAVQATQAAIYFGVSGAVESGLADEIAAPSDALVKVAGQGAGTSPIARLEADLAAARADADGRVETAIAATWAVVDDATARCTAVRKNELLGEILASHPAAAEIGARVTDVLAARQSAEIRNVLGGDGHAEVSSLVKAAIQGANQNQRR